MSEHVSDSGVPCSTLVELLRWRATHQPDRRAYTFLLDGETQEVNLTYAELDRQARAIAALLQNAGAVGQRVLLLYPPGLDFIAAFFGCLYGGAIAVPVYPPDPARLDRTLPRLQAIAKDAQPAIALTTSPILKMFDLMLAPRSDLDKMLWLTTGNIGLDIAANWQDPGVSGSTIAMLQYTSGSTANPNGVVLSHDNILYNEEMIKQAFEHTEESTVVSWLPLYHDMGLIGNVLQALYTCAQCILMSPVHFLQRPFSWLQAISRYSAVFSGGPDFAYDLCVRKISADERATLDLSSWQGAFNGAEPVRHQTLERFIAAFESTGFCREAFKPAYGLAEASVFVTAGGKWTQPVFYAVSSARLERGEIGNAITPEEDSRILVGCGKTWLAETVEIVNPQSLVGCQPNEVGEIWVSGPHIAQGYWNRPEMTEHTFRAYLADSGEGPFLRTGDLGFLKDGELFVTGRIKDLIIIGGENHYPQDIEWTMQNCHPAIRPGCCVAFSVEADGEERLVVAAEINPRVPDFDPRQVVQAIRQAVAEDHQLQVHDIVLLQAQGIPKTSSGKIQRHACRASYLAGTLDTSR